MNDIAPQPDRLERIEDALQTLTMQAVGDVEAKAAASTPGGRLKAWASSNWGKVIVGLVTMGVAGLEARDQWLVHMETSAKQVEAQTVDEKALVEHVTEESKERKKTREAIIDTQIGIEAHLQQVRKEIRIANPRVEAKAPVETPALKRYREKVKRSRAGSELFGRLPLPTEDP